MTDARPIARRLAADLPDIARFVETRAMLLLGADVFGGSSAAQGLALRLLDGARSIVAVVGRPAPEALAAALDGATAMTPIVGQTADAAHIETALKVARPGEAWRLERMVWHTLAGPLTPAPPQQPGIVVRLLGGGDSLAHVPPGLQYEMMHARAVAPVTAAFVDGAARAFCYSCWTTESLWDVSVDTLEPYRGRGLAEAVARAAIARRRGEGLQPVWGAVDTNGTSRRLAARLGFVETDEAVVFSRGPWAYFTRGLERT